MKKSIFHLILSTCLLLFIFNLAAQDPGVQIIPPGTNTTTTTTITTSSTVVPPVVSTTMPSCGPPEWFNCIFVSPDTIRHEWDSQPWLYMEIVITVNGVVVHTQPVTGNSFTYVLNPPLGPGDVYVATLIVYCPDGSSIINMQGNSGQTINGGSTYSGGMGGTIIPPPGPGIMGAVVGGSSAVGGAQNSSNYLLGMGVLRYEESCEAGIVATSQTVFLKAPECEEESSCDYITFDKDFLCPGKNDCVNQAFKMEDVCECEEKAETEQEFLECLQSFSYSYKEGNDCFGTERLSTLENVTSATIQPVPFGEYLRVMGHEPNATLLLTNAQGQIILQDKLDDVTENLIRTSHLPVGIYFYQLSTKDTIQTGKLLKVK